jgi:DNA recombination protein RmuC
MEIYLGVALFFVLVFVLLLFFLLKNSQTKDFSLFQQQMLELARQINEIKLQNQEFSKILVDGQLKNLEVLQSQLTNMVSTFNQQINSLTQTLNEQLIKTQGNIGQQLEGTIKIISNVQTKLGELSETAKNMEELGKDIKKLENILQAPKLRGNIGEFFLEDLLKQILPGQNYEIQYRFKDNTVVDAVIKIGEHLVPVDSKFPLESFNRIVEANTEEEKKRAKREFVDSLKKKIDEIANKYIRPAENTYEFALMYIPAENVFYEMIIRDDQLIGDKNLSNYAIEKRVIPVSPNSFYAYLMVIIFGLKGMQIEKEAQNIRGRIGELQQNFKKFYEIFTKIGKNIYFAQKYYEDAKRIAEIFGDRMALVSGEKVELKELSE